MKNTDLNLLSAYKKNFNSFIQASFLGKTPFNTAGKRDY